MKRLLLTGLAALVIGCGGDDKGCKTDANCKGERVCNLSTGLCEEPEEPCVEKKYFEDNDEDGFGSTDFELSCDGYGVFNSLDCNDKKKKINPSALELCDYIDNNCNGLTDEIFPIGEGCSKGKGECYTKGKLDCSSDKLGVECDAKVKDSNKEICDLLDNDCDGKTDEDLSQKCQTACGSGLEKCVEGKYVSCDAPIPLEEICDGKDNDCDGETDEGFGVSVYKDSDGDGFGNKSISWSICPNTPKEGYVNNGDDCHDANKKINPNAKEVCDSIDNNCDGYTDETFPNLGKSCYDGVGECKEEGKVVCKDEVAVCTASAGKPLEEVCDGKDNDCDGKTDETYWEIKFKTKKVWVQAISSLNNSDFFVAGSILGKYDKYFVAKGSNLGEIKWEKLIKNDSANDPRAIGEDSQGNLLVANHSKQDYIGRIVKLNKDGKLIWQKKTPDFFINAGVLDDGFVMAGYDIGNNALVAMFDSSGSKKWISKLGSGELWNINKTKKGYVTSWVKDNKTFVYHLDNQGKVIFGKQYNLGLGKYSSFSSIKEQGNFFAVGKTWVGGNKLLATTLILDEKGNKINANTYEPGYFTDFVKIGNNYLVIGEKEDYKGPEKAWMYVMDSLGKKVSETTLNYSSNNSGLKIVETKSGFYMLANFEHFDDKHLIKLDEKGKVCK